MRKKQYKITQTNHQITETVVAYGSQKRDVTPEELYDVIVDDVKAIYAVESI